jgi:hypothetical protein
MTLNDEDLKRIFRSYVDKRDSGTRQGCPSFSELSGFFEPGTPRTKKLKIIDHITSCSACADEFDFLRGLNNYEKRLAQNAREIRAKNSSYSTRPYAEGKRAWIWRYAPITAGVLFLVVSLAVVLKWERPGDSRTATSLVTLQSPGRGQSVSITMVFEWKSFQEADSYILEVFDDVLLPIWKSGEITSTLFKPPEEFWSRLRPDGSYFWMVTALKGGNKLAESELRRFALARKFP